MENITPDQIKAKIKEAEDCVSAMKDESLKKVAFETILSKLLSAGKVECGVPGNAGKVKHTRSTKNGGRKTATVGQAGQERKSDVVLDVDQLKKLKDYFDAAAPDGTENVVFTIAYFVDQTLGKKKFHEGDVNAVYKSLLSIRPIKRPPAMTVDQMKRALTWLVAPSRKKMWLKLTADGMFEISPQGTLHMTYGEEKSDGKK